MTFSRKRSHSTLISDYNEENQFKRRNFSSLTNIKNHQQIIHCDDNEDVDSYNYYNPAISKHLDSDRDILLDMVSSMETGAFDHVSHFDPSKDYQYQYDANNNTKGKSISRTTSFSNGTKKSIISTQDKIAREHCFDYIVQAIDEVWARYCDTTSNAEAKVYSSMNTNSKHSEEICLNLPNLSKDIDQVESNENEFDHHNHHQSYKPLNLSDQEESDLSESDDEDEDKETSGYKSEATNLTEYETDSGGDHRTVSRLPDSINLQSLKSRLLKAKDDLEQVYDSIDLSDCIAFWRRWDMIKYSAVEVMEDDDDDEIIENAIMELEEGRFYRE
ncbi:uncharacterized protein NDAI_0A00200 [Naumovozyma dairenensis CBS 421]|uniref:Uncharacterized protein n=1 Tax=Naumovozyma dairenensis (strain ATCC 10597 / BCRC 20456 / CBS 421 / NBRC 0211 / NRRL Y-12639) TaxID=1071378 RepID=G0W5G6_NAUDC|nr:hypothetical protein NDAI_0A00200 [Naumovozyma dairenensis CBS 421]CCD22180.1 hypothetical protein NDAI_0A00200 [Naumovozyma dairenensis CBS 421]